MYLKIEKKGKKPSFYKLIKDDILLGSLSSCDIVISDPHISKKHLKIFLQEKSLFIQDNGSTNGTFLDKERLIPGKRIQIDSTSVISVGGSVFLSVAAETDSRQWIEVKSKVSSENSLGSTQNEKTTVLSIEDFKAADALARKIKAEKLIEKRKENKLKKKKDNFLMLKAALATLIIFAIGFYFNKTYKFNDRKKETNITKAAKALANQQDKLDKIE